MIQTDEDFQLILKEFEINQKAILIEIKKLPYQIRTESRTRSRTGSYKLTPRVKDLFKNIQIEVDPERIRPIDADLQIPDTSKFTKKTGWKPEIPFEKTMLDLLEYWRKRTLREGQNLIR